MNECVIFKKSPRDSKKNGIYINRPQMVNVFNMIN